MYIPTVKHVVLIFVNTLYKSPLLLVVVLHCHCQSSSHWWCTSMSACTHTKLFSSIFGKQFLSNREDLLTFSSQSSFTAMLLGFKSWNQNQTINQSLTIIQLNNRRITQSTLKMVWSLKLTLHRSIIWRFLSLVWFLF